MVSCQGCIGMEENNLEWYVRHSVEPLIESVKAPETIEYNDTVNKKELKESLETTLQETACILRKVLDCG